MGRLVGEKGGSEGWVGGWMDACMGGREGT